MRLWTGILALNLLAAVLAPLSAAPSAPSQNEWVNLVTYADYTCGETVVAASCEIDIERLKGNFAEMRKHYALTGEEQHTLDNRLTVCLGGKPPPPKMTVEPKICARAIHAVSELDRLFTIAAPPSH